MCEGSKARGAEAEWRPILEKARLDGHVIGASIPLVFGGDVERCGDDIPLRVARLVRRLRGKQGKSARGPEERDG